MEPMGHMEHMPRTDHLQFATEMNGHDTSDTLQRTIRLPDSPCLNCGTQAFTAVVLHRSGDPLCVKFCPSCNTRDVRAALTGELRAALDGLEGLDL